MRLRLLAVLFPYVGALCVCLSPNHCVAAPTVWSGLTVSFGKPNNANHTLPAFQDRITDDVWLTRGTSAGLLNFHDENLFTNNSPLGTRWATVLNNPGKSIAATNWSDLTFGNWITAYGGQTSSQLPARLLANNAVVHLINDDIYLDLQVTAWTASGGGGFAYIRSAAVPEPTTAVLAGIAMLALTTWRRRAR